MLRFNSSSSSSSISAIALVATFWLVLVLVSSWSSPLGVSAQVRDNMVPIDWRELPLADSADKVEVYHLEASLFKAKYGNTFAKLHLFHVGVGFINKKSGYRWTVEFDALPTFEDAVFPRIIRENNRTKLNWQNNGGAIVYNGINETYWDAHPWQLVTTVDGETHNTYITEFLAGFNATHPRYNPLNVFAKWHSDPAKRKEYIHGYTCADFVWESFQVLYDYGARFDCKVVAKKNYLNYYAKEAPTKVNFEDSRHRQKIVEFYETVMFKFKTMPLPRVFKSLWELFIKGHVYLRQNDDYYLVKLHLPDMGWRYAREALPGCKL